MTALAARRVADRTSDLISVLVVDDSAVARAALGRIVTEAAELSLAGSVSGAEAAIAFLEAARVDVVLLDLEMPGVGGLEALPQLITAGRGAHVLVVSSTAAAGARATVRALSLGAADTLEKPHAGLLNRNFGSILVDRVLRLGRARTAVEAPAGYVLRPPQNRPVSLLAIAASTGGIRAVQDFLGALPHAFRAPILITQHLPESFIPYFAEQLTAQSGREARVAEDGALLTQGRILVAPGHAHLCVVNSDGLLRVSLDSAPAASRCLPSADPMFASIAALEGEGALGVVLTGMGRDGSEGAAALVNAGGSLLAQDAASSTVWGMPGSVTRAGLVELVASPRDLALHVSALRSA